MSFLLSNYKELSFEGLIAVNGGCYYTSKPPFPKDITGGRPNVGCISSSGFCNGKTNAGQINAIQFIPTMINDGYGPDKRGYWSTLKPEGQMIMG